MPEPEKMPVERIYSIIQFSYWQAASAITTPRNPVFAKFCQIFLQIWVKPDRCRIDAKRIIVDFKKETVLKIAHYQLKTQSSPRSGFNASNRVLNSLLTI